MIYIVCAGEEGRVVLGILSRQRLLSTVGGFFDDSRVGQKVEGINVIGRISDISSHVRDKKSDCFVVALGDNLAREKLSRGILEKGLLLYNVFAQSAEISTHVKIGGGVIVHPMAYINTRAEIGRGAIINTRATIEHDCRVGDYAHIAPGAILQGGVKVGDYSLIGAGANIREDRSVGKNCVVGMGSVVTKDVPDNSVVYGNPARLIRENK